MPIATFLELCMDTDGDDTLGRFWAETIGSDFRPDAGGLGNVVGEYEYQSIAMCQVPEPKTVKHRIHLDIYARASTSSSREERACSCPRRRAASSGR